GIRPAPGEPSGQSAAAGRRPYRGQGDRGSPGGGPLGDARRGGTAELVMTELRLLTPGETAASVLFPAFEEAYRADRRVWYLMPGSRERRIRLRQLAGRMPLLDPPVGTLEDLA